MVRLGRPSRRPCFAKIDLTFGRREAGRGPELPLSGLPEGPGLNLVDAFVHRTWQRLPVALRQALPLGSPTDRSRLNSVEDFFRYTEEEGKRFFEELDRDNDGRVKVEDLKVAMRKRKLPERYARDFMRRAKTNWFSDSIGWDDFHDLMHTREAFTLRAYNSLRLNRSGHLQLPSITTSLKRLGLPATEENATAMLRYLGRAEDGYISYGQFRNFLLLLPPEQVRSTDPSVLWFEAASAVQLRAPQVAAGATGMALLKAALAGALASGTSTAALHPLDTLKTRIQASVGKAPGILGVARLIPDLGPRRLYLGIVPAVLGASVSHGVRTASYEAARLALAPLAALTFVSDLHIQGLASGFGTFLGTGIRIPNEVLKQRLQTGQHASAPEALRAVLRGGGVRALFAGTAATLAREVPFYVLGMVCYEQLKKIAAGVKGHDLSAWETIAVGAASGALAAVATTPADVLKTRIMTGRAPPGVSALALAARMAQEEGFFSLYKGWNVRALWIAPVGAMNFAGYELAKRMLDEPPSGAATAPAPAAGPASAGAGPAAGERHRQAPRDVAAPVAASAPRAVSATAAVHPAPMSDAVQRVTALRDAAPAAAMRQMRAAGAALSSGASSIGGAAGKQANAAAMAAGRAATVARDRVRGVAAVPAAAVAEGTETVTEGTSDTGIKSEEPQPAAITYGAQQGGRVTASGTDSSLAGFSGEAVPTEEAPAALPPAAAVSPIISDEGASGDGAGLQPGAVGADRNAVGEVGVTRVLPPRDEGAFDDGDDDDDDEDDDPPPLA